jgi:copper oxidase (laccase) domain-containing protein
MCRPDLYHSYRREGKGAGRMISFVGFGLEAAG